MDMAKFPQLEDMRINGVREFGSPEDDVIVRLEEAHGLLSMISAAHQACTGEPGADTDAFASINHEIQSRAFHGIATLIAVACHQLEAADTRRNAAKTGGN